MRSSEPAPKRWHRPLENTGELRLRIRGESLAGLMSEAARALGLLLLGSTPAQGSSTTRLVTVESRDREGLLVDWLNELIYLAETELWVPAAVDVLEIADTRLRASVDGVAVDEAPALVKAATLHGVRVDRHGDGFEAEVVLDV
jgi:SHS2 domain-containing protein